MTACQNPLSSAVGTTMRRYRKTVTGSSHWNQWANSPMRTTAAIPSALSSVNRSACEPEPRVRRAPKQFAWDVGS